MHSPSAHSSDQTLSSADSSDEPRASFTHRPAPSPLRQTSYDLLDSTLRNEKVNRIRDACTNRDLKSLIALAVSEDGLVQDEFRRTAWPILLGSVDVQLLSPSSSITGQPRPSGWRDLQPHRDEGQVQLDVNRSFIYYPDNESEKRLKARKKELSDVITAVLRQHPLLCYFQGYHDIVQVFLLVLGADAAVLAVARLSLLRIRDFMLPTLSAAEPHLHLLPHILYAVDPYLLRHLSGATKPTPFFALAATLTLYAHDIEQYGDIARLFDYLLASEAVVPVYLFAVIVISRKQELLAIDHDEPEMLHSVLSKLPKPLNLEKLIQSAQDLFRRYPPETLPNRAWKQISSYSVLKTTRDPVSLVMQSLQDGERFFEKHAAEIRRQETIQLIRQRARDTISPSRRARGLTAVAVVVAAFAWYLGRHPLSDNAVLFSSFTASWRHSIVTVTRRLIFGS